MQRFRITVATCAIVLSTTIVLMANPAGAEDYFIPNAQKPAAAAPAPATRPAPRPVPVSAIPPAPAPVPSSMSSAALPPILAPGSDADVPTGPLPPLPPLAPLPPLDKTTPPPAPVIGVLGVPEIMRASLAAQSVDRIIGERREKLNEEAQKEQAAWREMQQALANQRATMSPEQVRIKERELQDRITSSQKLFRDRARIVQEAAQYGFGQIERALIAVIRQVAESHGMNLVLHRSQVALNVAELDISEQVVTQLNKVLPSVVIPPDGVSPSAMPTPPTPVVGPTNAAPSTLPAPPADGPRR